MGTSSSGRGRGRPPYPLLTPAEERVLEHLRRGLTNAEIAERLGVTLDAVKYHVSNMLGKLQVENREQLAAWRGQSPVARAWAAVTAPWWKVAALGAVLVASAAVALFVVLGSGSSGDTRAVFGPEDLFSGVVSVGVGGKPADGPSENPSISGDGRLVAFESEATNLVAGDTNGVSDVFVFDRLTKETRRVSLAPGGKEANGASHRPSISADGKWVAFDSEASNLVAGDVNGELDRAVLALPEERRAEIQNAKPDTGQANFAALSRVWGGNDVFVVELASGDIELVSAADDEERGTLGSFAPSISGDGRFVAFETFAPNFVGLSAASGGPPAGSGSFIGAGADYVVLRDREAKSTTLVSHDLEGKAPNGGSGRAIVSIDGDTVGFVSRQMDLTGASQLSFGSYVFYRWDRASGELNRADVPLPPGAADARMSVALEASSPALAHDGASVAFYSSVRVVGGSPSQPDETFRSLYVWRDDRVRSLDVSGLEPVTTQNYAGITFVGGTELVVQVNNAPTGATPAIVETRLVVCNLNSGACSSIASAQGADLWAPVASSDGTAIAGIRFGRSQGEPNLIVVFAR